MKLFISYSRDDKAWVYELWRALRDRAHHDAWIDQRIAPAQDWWGTILKHIEECDCFLYVLTPKSADSIFCAAEVAYAAALNKPILPLMLKPCDYPDILRSRRLQYHSITDDSSLSDVLFVVANGLTEVRVGLVQNHYPAPEIAPARPAEPQLQQQPSQASEVFMLAEEAAQGGNFSLAEKLFSQIMGADPQVWGAAAAERLGELRFERGRDRDYLNIVQMAANPTLLKGAKAAAKAFAAKYGNAYDPQRVLTTLLTAESHAPPSALPSVPSPVVVPDAPPPPDPLATTPDPNAGEESAEVASELLSATPAALKTEHFTQRSRRVLALAQEEAVRFKHTYIGTQHLLLGLMREEGGVARRVLLDVLTLDIAKAEAIVVGKRHPSQLEPNARPDLAPGTKKALELAVDEARRMGHHYIGTEHLLLGLLRQAESDAVYILKQLNTSQEEVRRTVRRVLQESGLPPPASPSSNKG
jgi:hypothetical protein